MSTHTFLHSYKFFGMRVSLLLLSQLLLFAVSTAGAPITTVRQDTPPCHSGDALLPATSVRHAVAEAISEAAQTEARGSRQRWPCGAADEQGAFTGQGSPSSEDPAEGGVAEPRGVDLSWYKTFLTRANFTLGILNRVLGVIQSIIV